MSMVEITVRQYEGKVIWQQIMDRDSVYFENFRRNVELDLQAGWSMTIVSQEELNETEITQTRWN